ncbi:MAG: ATP-binding cassette domain-containing protein [Hungatella sp.]
MIKVKNLSYSFPQKELYHEISFTIEEKQHCAFIGTSGTGKSTLVDLLMHPEQYLFDGILEISSSGRIGYVSQFSQLDAAEEMTVFDYVAEEFTAVQQRIDRICAEMETASDLEPLLEQYQQALDVFHSIDGDHFESNVTKKLKLANLNRHRDLPVSKLSGGEFKLIQVLKEMLTVPDLIIMDEPDVFLDFDHLVALGDLINSHNGMLLVITHNRYLLNHCFNKIIHLENTELQEFSGRYIDYNFSLLQRKIELQELAGADTEEIERNQKVVDQMRLDATNFICASKGRTLDARVALLQRLEARRNKEPFVEMKQPEIVLEAEPESSEEIILKIHDYCLSFQDVLLEHVNFEMKSTDKVALIGPNGTGKTTLLRDIYQNNQPSIEIAADAKVAFLSQLQGEMLKESHTIREEFFEAGFQTREEMEAYLADYGFTEELMNQKIELLSGGEKNLLQLAKIAMSKANFLLLDEPTGHMDTYSQLALEQAISQYTGAILMISHDFYSIVNGMDYVILIEDKTIRKISIRKFRKMIYANHFDKDYLEMEQKKQVVEMKIATALKNKDFELAKVLSEELKMWNKLL